jgi:hypothetical protein
MIHGVWPIVIILLLVVLLAGPTLRRVLREARERDIIEEEARREKVRIELMGEYPTVTSMPVITDSAMPPYHYWAE